MSDSNVNNAAAPRQVKCEPLDNDQIPADLNALRHSRTFKRKHEELDPEEHDAFPGAFPVKAISRTSKKVDDWCKEHEGEPEPVIKKDPLTRKVEWFKFTETEHRFFDVPMSELLELVMEAKNLGIPRLYHGACQSVAACIRGRNPREICDLLQQDCDLSRARMNEICAENPWLSTVTGARNMKPVFIPNEVLVTIFEKLPREDLERLQLVSTQFDDVIRNSSKLSEHEGPLRIVARLKLGASSDGSRLLQKSDVWLRDGTKVTCPDHKSLIKRLKFSTVEKLRVGCGGVHDADVQDLSALLPVQSAWKSANVNISMSRFRTGALFERLFTELLLCKEIALVRENPSLTWSHSYMRLPAIVACDKLDIRGLTNGEIRLSGTV